MCKEGSKIYDEDKAKWSSRNYQLILFFSVSIQNTRLC